METRRSILEVIPGRFTFAKVTLKRRLLIVASDTHASFRAAYPISTERRCAHLPASKSLRNNTPIVLHHRLQSSFRLAPLPLRNLSLLVPDIRPQHHARQHDEDEYPGEDYGDNDERKLPSSEACGAEFDPGVGFAYTFWADSAGVERAGA